MSDPLPPLPEAGGARALRRLFLTLFLRGRSAREMRKGSAPKSVASKLALTLSLYGLFGMLAFLFLHQPVLFLSVYLHSMTFVFLGMFVAAAAGEVLFNKEESDILLHRPVTPRAFLWAKVWVLVRVSIWIAAAFNAAGLAIGLFAPDGGLAYPLAHAVSMSLEAVFCTGSVVVVYQLCLRFFGRERLDGLMTMAQVLVAVGAMLSGQIFPLLLRQDGLLVQVDLHTWWIWFLPPAWFAAFDEALAGGAGTRSWSLVAAGLVATAGVLLLAFRTLARDYGSGLRALGEAAAPPATGGRGRLLQLMVKAPPLRWWLRDPVSRASFLLTTAYLARDRDVKLRVYPGLAPVLIFPLLGIFRDRHDNASADFDGFNLALAGAFLGLIPLLALNLLQYSQQWQAADLFRAAPLSGPAPLCAGARRAVLLFVTLPIAICIAILAFAFLRDLKHAALFLPGLILAPLMSLVPGLWGNAVPLSCPIEEGKAATRGLIVLPAMMVAVTVALIALASWNLGWFWWLILGETALVAAAYKVMVGRTVRARWQSLE